MLIKSLKSIPILFDASILLVGVDKQNTDPNYSFQAMKEVYLEEIFNYFECIKIHEFVWAELDEVRKTFIQPYIGKNVEIVTEGNLYGRDPKYTDIFNKISKFDLFRYRRMESKNKGDVFSLAYAAHHNIPYLSTRDGSIIAAMNEIVDLKDVELLGFEHILLLGFIANQNPKSKSYNAIYKAFCTPAINSKLIPSTFNQFINEQLDN